MISNSALTIVDLHHPFVILAQMALHNFPPQKERKYIERLSEIKFHGCVTSDVWYGMVKKADAITKRLLIKQTKLQLTYLCISVLTLNKF